MSDVFTRYKSLCFSQDLSEVQLANTELHHLYNRESDQTVFSVKIPFPLLKLWHKFVTENQSICKVGFVDLLEWSIPGNAFVFVQEDDVRSQIDENLRKIAGSVCQMYKNTKGRARKQLDDRIRTYHIKEYEIKSVVQWREEVECLENQIEEWRKKYKDLEKSKQSLYELLLKEIQTRNDKIEQLDESNAELLSYISELEKRDKQHYAGKTLASSKNKSRTIKNFLNKAQSALWFSKSFGLDIKAIVVKDQQSTGVTERLNINNETITKSYNNLSAEEKAKVEQVLFLLDKFCVGDMFYHEFSFICDGLPKSYLIKQCRDSLNNMCHITSLPESFNGCQVSSATDLIKDSMSDFLKTNKFSPEKDKMKIKINGDGARMTRNSSYIILSFSLLQCGQDVMSAKGNRTIAVVDAGENYNTLKVAFHSVFDQINSLINDGFIEVKGKNISTEFFLGGDYKFILMMLGLKGATAEYACAWCKTAKDKRWCVGKSFVPFNEKPLKRTLEEIKKLSKKRPTKENYYNYSCENEPLLNIELDHVVVDELHLMLRITDRLLENLINYSLDWDQLEEIDQVRGAERGVHLKKTVNFISSLGISFNVWEVKNADGKGSGRYDWTSLMGNDKKKLLFGLTEKDGVLDLFRNEEIGKIFLEVWRKFADIYSVITNWSPEITPSDIFNKASNWIKLFLSLNGKMKGHERARVTPYMHILVAHVPYFLKSFKSIKIFTGQGVEKNNDTARNVVLRKSNKWNAPADILKLENRQWLLRSQEREKRKYTKRNSEYWEEGIKNKRKK